MLLLLENFDNAEAQRHIAGTLTLAEGDGKGGSNAVSSLTPSNKISFKPSTRMVLGFYTLSYTTGYVYVGYTTPDGSQGESFRIIFTLTSAGVVTISFYNPRQNYITDYPTISNQTAYQDIGAFSLIEIYLDLYDAEAYDGELKIAIDGVEYVSLSGIVNAPIDQYTSGLTSDKANYGWVAFSGFPTIDSLYVCNQQKGYNDDFFGPYDLSTLGPDRDGDYTNWEPREYSEAVDEGLNHLFVDKIPFDPDDAEYLNVIASQTLVKDLFYFAAGDIDGSGEVMALEHRIWHKGLSEDQDDEICVIVPIAKATGCAITEEADYQELAQAFYYSQLRMPYDVVPSVSFAWTRENLNNTQFGYCFYETEEVDAVDDATLTSTNIVSGALTNLTDDDSGTSLYASDVTFTFASAIKLKKLIFEANSGGAVQSVTIYDENGGGFSMESPSYSSGVTTVLNAEEHLNKDILQITVTMNSYYCIYSASVIAWEKVGA